MLCRLQNCLKIPVFITLVLLLSAPRIAYSGAEPVADGNLQSCERYNTIISDAQKLPDNPLTANFSKPVLPGDDRFRLTVQKQYSAWNAQKVCGIIVWKKNPQENDIGACNSTNSRSVCSPLGPIAVTGDVQDVTTTLLRFTVPLPAENIESDANPFRNDATIYLVAYDKQNDLVFTMVHAISVSTRSWSIATAFAFSLFVYLGIVIISAAQARDFPHGTSSWKRFSGTFNPARLTAGVHGKASLSRLQILGFSLIVAYLVIYTWCRYGLLLDLSSDLLLLMGISAAGATGAKLTAVAKKRPNPEIRIFLAKKLWTEPDRTAGQTTAKFGDLFMTDGRLNVYKFQMALFSLIVAIVLVSSGTTETGVIVISDTYLALLGLGQGVYIAGKAISESDISTFENIILDMQVKEEAYFIAGGVPAAPTDNFSSFTPAFPASNAYKDYKKSAEKARLAFQTLYDISIRDNLLLPN